MIQTREPEEMRVLIAVSSQVAGPERKNAIERCITLLGRHRRDCPGREVAFK